MKSLLPEVAIWIILILLGLYVFFIPYKNFQEYRFVTQQLDGTEATAHIKHVAGNCKDKVVNLDLQIEGRSVIISKDVGSTETVFRSICQNSLGKSVRLRLREISWLDWLTVEVRDRLELLVDP